MPRIAALQMTSSASVKENLRQVEIFFAKAREEAVDLLILPENFAFMGLHEKDKLAIAENYGEGEIQEKISQLARHYHLWVVAGTIPLKGLPNRVRASCMVFDAQGNCVARYDKIHLFDVCVSKLQKVSEEVSQTTKPPLSHPKPSSKRLKSPKQAVAESLSSPLSKKTGKRSVLAMEIYQESLSVEKGTELVVVDTPVGKIGLSVCYDLRFPELYQQLIVRGAEIFAIPSAFTAVTGAAHWEILLRARAIENLCYVVAPNQVGHHENGRWTYGHSMIVEPWGKIIAHHDRGIGMISADLDLKGLQKLRRQFPCNDHHVL